MVINLTREMWSFWLPIITLGSPSVFVDRSPYSVMASRQPLCCTLSSFFFCLLHRDTEMCVQILKKQPYMSHLSDIFSCHWQLPLGRSRISSVSSSVC